MGQNHIEIVTYDGEGYLPLIDFQTWRVAVLRYCEELKVQNIKIMQRHHETDEVFVLLEGNCTLFIGGDSDCIGDIEAIKMEPLKMYNVKKGVWHSHTLDKQAMVLIVENQDTCDNNSPVQSLNEKQCAVLCRIGAL